MFYYLKKNNPVLLIKYLFVHKILLEKYFFSKWAMKEIEIIKNTSKA